MNIEEIMKPYFDKQKEIETINKMELPEEYNDLISQQRIIELRLNRLRENKEQEINEYVQNAVSDRPDFYAGYGAMIRKDLEQAYLDKEQELENSLKEIQNKIDDMNNSRNMIIENARKFHNVDVRELCEIKNSLRAPLIRELKRLEIKLEELNLSFDNVMLELSKFNYIYDDKHNIQNRDEYKRLFDESNKLIELKYNVKNEIKKVNSYLSLMELTPEEIAVSMMGMTPWEREEYELRKFAAAIRGNNQEDFENLEELELDEAPIENLEEEPIENLEEDVELEEEESIEDFGGTEWEPIENLEYDEKVMADEKYSEFISNIFKDVLQCAKKSKTIEIEDGKIVSESLDEENSIDTENSENDIQLPNGVYMNRRELYKALDNYAKKNKGATFVVEGIDQKFEINRKTVRAIKKHLRDSSVRKLLVNKKLSFFDIKRVYGKEKAEEYNQPVIENKNMVRGEYINLFDFTQNLKYLFTEKSLSLKEIFVQMIDKIKEETQKEEIDSIGQKTK